MSNIELLHQETSVSPFTLGVYYRGFHQTKKNHKYLKPLYFKNSFVVFKGDKVDWYGDMDNFKEMADKIINDVKKDPKYSQRLLTDVNKLTQKIFNEGKIILKLNLRKLSSQTIASHLNKMYQLGQDISDLGMVAVIPDLRHSKLTTLLKDIIKQRIQRFKIKKQINYYFTPLITPTGRGLVHQEKLVILKLVKKVSQNKELNQLFKKYTPDYINNFLKNKFPVIFKEIENIHHNYKWLYFGQLGPAKSFTQYLEDIKVYLQDKKFKQEYSSLIKEGKNLKRLHNQYTKELHLNNVEEKLFMAARDFSYNKTCRFDALLFDYYVLDQLLKEISKRSGWIVKDLRYMSVEEIIKLLQNKKCLKNKEIKTRERFCITIIRGKRIHFLTGVKAKNYLKQKVKNLKVEEDKTIIHGMSAFLGKVSGTVKIVNSPKDIIKIKTGDVLVSVQTNPDLLPAMKKAAAFVTDIGGITSHAAIVAREMKKPCIVGTKVATTIFKDGDKIEVDAVKGDVKKI